MSIPLFTGVALLAFPTSITAFQAQRLNEALPPGGDVGGNTGLFLATEEAAYFIADQERDDVLELYRVDLDGGRRLTKLSPPLAAERDVESDFVLSPDGRWLIYRSDQEVDEKLELFAVRTDGRSSPVKISGSMPDFSDVRGFLIAPDGARVVFLADRNTDNVLDFFSVDSSAAPIQLNELIAPGGQLTSFEISADSRHVVYRGDLLEDGVFELFSAPIDASGGQLRLNGALPPHASLDGFQISPDATRVAFSGRFSSTQRELFAAPIDGSSPAIGLIQMATTRSVREYRHTADGARIVFEAGPVDNARLYSVPGDGSQVPVLLGGGSNVEFAIPASGPWVVFRTDSGLFSTLVDGSQAPTFLSTMSTVRGEFAITPDDTRVVFSSYSAPRGTHVVPIDGSAPARLLMERGYLGEDFEFGLDGESVVFRFINLLFAVPLDGSRAGEVVGGRPVPGGGVGWFQVLGAGRVVFRADLQVIDVNELWLAIQGGAPHAVRR